MIKDTDPTTKYFSIDPNVTLEDCLKNTKFYEIPTFMIVKQSDVQYFLNQNQV